jgi:hypothetical protein
MTHEPELPVADDPAFEIGKLFRRGIEAWIECGERLLAEKAGMPYGEWSRWLHDNRDKLGFGERAAQRLMEVAADPQLAADLWWHKKQRLTSANGDGEKQKAKQKQQSSTGNDQDDDGGAGARQAASSKDDCVSDYASATHQMNSLGADIVNMLQPKSSSRSKS